MMEIFLWLLAFGAGLLLLEWGADTFTERIGLLATRLRAPESVVGLLTAGGEWEELLVVLVALIGGHPGIALGNIVGSCVANLLGSFPLGALRRPLTIDRPSRGYGFVLLGATIVVALFLSDGDLVPVEGALSLLLFAGYVASVVIVIRRGARVFVPDNDDDDDAAAHKPLIAQLGWMAVGLGAILLGSELLVEAVVRAARSFGISEIVLGATVLAIGTTLPDKAMSLIGGLKGQSGVVTGNAVGNNLFLLLLVAGIAALVHPLTSDTSLTLFRLNLAALVGATLLLALLFLRAQLGRGTAIGLLLLYVGYFVANLAFG